MKVYLFYRTDEHLNYNGAELVYIGTDKEASIKKLMRLKREPITKEQAEQIRQMGQSQCRMDYEWIVEGYETDELICGELNAESE